MSQPRTDDERLAIVADWRESGLSGAEFARERGVKLHTLRMWARRLRSRVDDALEKPHTTSSRPIDGMKRRRPSPAAY